MSSLGNLINDMMTSKFYFILCVCVFVDPNVVDHNLSKTDFDSYFQFKKTVLLLKLVHEKKRHQKIKKHMMSFEMSLK